MAWTAQAGLGPRTVALYLKVFIVVMLYAHGRLGICTAQPTRLPQELQSNLNEMIKYLCSNGTSCRGNSRSCVPRLSSIKMLCQQVCSPPCPYHCWKTPTDEAPLCRMNQNRICGYKDATVCQLKDGRGTCVYRKDPSLTFCVCQGQEIKYDRCKKPTDPDPTAQATTTNQQDDSETNVAAIVLGSLFALLLLLVIIGAVILCLHRQGRLPSFRKKTAKPAEMSSGQLDARNATRVKLPDLPVPGSSMEYSYAYDHRPAKPGAQENSNQDDHTYFSVGEGGYREGNSCYVLDGQRKIPAIKEPELDTSIRVQSKEVSDEDYTSLAPTGNPKSLISDPFGDEVESPTLANECDVTSSIELPTEGLSSGDAGTYFPLILTAEPKSPKGQSGYEDAKIPTSESHDATSPTGAQSISCDDSTYTPLVRTAEPKSQQEHSGNEAALIPNPGLATDSDDTFYDHLDRKEENESTKGALSTVDVDDYQHLVNNDNN